MYRHRSEPARRDVGGAARRAARLTTLAVTVAAMVVTSLGTATASSAAGAPSAVTVKAATAKATALRAPVLLQSTVAPAANIRSGPATRYRVIATLRQGGHAWAQFDTATGWYRLASGRYIARTVVRVVPAPKPAVKAPAAKPAAPKPATPKPGSATPPTAPPAAIPAGAAPAPQAPAQPPAPGGFTAGNLVADSVFYNTTAITEAQVRSFIAAKNAACTGPWCLRTLRVDTPSWPADANCAAYTGGKGKDAASVITAVATACGLNPQVMLVVLQQESGLLTAKTPTAASYQAAWGWGCSGVDTAGGGACAPQNQSGFFNQAYGMARQFASYRTQPAKYPYRAGQTAAIAYHPAAACGRASVRFANTATASLYNYTPYQPNAASLAGYPGAGDTCSSYGLRNFYFLFSSYFGATGGGTAVKTMATGTSVTIPASPFITGAMAGQTITAPNAAVARGIAAGLTAIGTPYVWGGGTSGGPADQGCARGAGQENSCQGTVGFDCSGLTAYVLRQAGFTIPGNSSAQRAAGTALPWGEAWPGDIVGYPGHVGIYLGVVDGTGYILDAPDVGGFVRVTAVSPSAIGTSVDATVHRYWQ